MKCIVSKSFWPGAALIKMYQRDSLSQLRSSPVVELFTFIIHGIYYLSSSFLAFFMPLPPTKKKSLASSLLSFFKSRKLKIDEFLILYLAVSWRAAELPKLDLIPFWPLFWRKMGHFSSHRKCSRRCDVRNKRSWAVVAFFLKLFE